MIETKLLEKLIDRAVEARMAEMRSALWVHHWLLTELIRQIPREAVRQVAVLMDEERLHMTVAERASVASSWDHWQLYLMQRGDVVTGDKRPQFLPNALVPEPRPPVKGR